MVAKENKVMVPDSSSESSSQSGATAVRGTWGSQLDFFLSCVGYAIGLGNLWRFPYLCMRNGGGAFLVPYFLFLFLCGMPLYFLEVSIGQFSSLSPVTIWKISPLFKGLGYGMCIVSGVVCIYYNVIMAWSLYYFVCSLTTGPLPWSTCDNWWNTPSCALRTQISNVSTIGQSMFEHGNLSVIDLDVSNDSVSVAQAVLRNLSVEVSQRKHTPAEEFWHHNALEISSGIEELGAVRWQLVICLALAWISVFLCLFKGVHSLGKVVYVTATLPYLMLFALLVRGVTLPGAARGLAYYLYPDFSQLLRVEVWGEACAQIFYSLGMAYGGLITMASYNTFHHNCYRISVVVPLINCVTSFVAGLVIFSVLGFMSLQSGVPVPEVITSGPGLAFVVYPEALSLLPGSAIWSALFFLMLFVVGLDTQFGMFETMVTGVVDHFPKLIRYKTSITGICCVLQFLLGIPMVTQGGIYIFQIFDWYSATFSLMFLALVECLVVAWAYGDKRIYGDLHLMLGKKPCWWWKICWKFISPIVLLTVLLFTISMFVRPSYGAYTYPAWAIVFGWCLALCSILPVPAVMLYQLFNAQGDLKQKMQQTLKPESDWGPRLFEHRKGTMYASTAEITLPLNSSSPV